MKKAEKKIWTKPVINTTLKIKETLGLEAPGGDGGPIEQQSSS
jgi:hypothetical protein